MSKKYFYVHYDLETNTQYVVEDGCLVKETKFEVCPYVWLGRLKEKIELGIIKWVAFKKVKLVN